MISVISAVITTGYSGIRRCVLRILRLFVLAAAVFCYGIPALALPANVLDDGGYTVTVEPVPVNVHSEAGYSGNTDSLFTIKDGDFSNPEVWSGGAIPGSSTSISVDHQITVSSGTVFTGNIQGTGVITVDEGAFFNFQMISGTGENGSKFPKLILNGQGASGNGTMVNVDTLLIGPEGGLSQRYSEGSHGWWHDDAGAPRHMVLDGLVGFDSSRDQIIPALTYAKVRFSNGGKKILLNLTHVSDHVKISDNSVLSADGNMLQFGENVALEYEDHWGDLNDIVFPLYNGPTSLIIGGGARVWAHRDITIQDTLLIKYDGFFAAKSLGFYYYVTLTDSARIIQTEGKFQGAIRTTRTVEPGVMSDFGGIGFSTDAGGEIEVIRESNLAVEVNGKMGVNRMYTISATDTDISSLSGNVEICYHKLDMSELTSEILGVFRVDHFTSWFEYLQPLPGFNDREAMKFSLSAVPNILGNWTFAHGAEEPIVHVDVPNDMKMFTQLPASKITVSHSYADSTSLDIVFVNGDVTNSHMLVSKLSNLSNKIPEAPVFPHVAAAFDITSNAQSFEADIVIGYTDSSLNSIPEDSLALSYYDEASNVWVPVTATIDTALNTVRYTTNSFSYWALTNREEPVVVSVIDDYGAVPVSYELEQNYPNPFNPSTTISYSIPRASVVNLRVYNLTGELVKELEADLIPAGNHTSVWDGTNSLGRKVSSGVYIYMLRTDSFVKSRKMVLLK